MDLCLISLNSRKFRILTVVDQYSRECVALEPDFL